MKILSCAGFLLFASVALATDEAALGAANAEFDAGNFEKAASAYEALLAAGPPSAELYYNLGNALDRSGKPLDAAINYERALILDPGLREARNNRALLAAARNVPLPPHRWQDEVVSVVHPQWLMVAGNVFGWLGLAGVGWMVLSERKRPGLIVIFGAALAFGSATFALGWASDPRNANATLAMVTSTGGTQLLSAPANNSAPLAELPAGSPLGVLSPRGAWTYCALASGPKGWVRTENITPVEPGGKF